MRQSLLAKYVSTWTDVTFLKIFKSFENHIVLRELTLLRKTSKDIQVGNYLECTIFAQFCTNWRRFFIRIDFYWIASLQNIFYVPLKFHRNFVYNFILCFFFSKLLYFASMAYTSWIVRKFYWKSLNSITYRKIN